jgi:hypothetical protein
MEFRTKLDFTTRQVSQKEKTFSNLSGGTIFGLPFSALSKGPDLTTVISGFQYTNVVSTFSGNSATTVYNWYDSNMNIGISQLSPWTPLNSGTTQYVDLAFTANTTTVVDGNVVALSYTGVSFDIKPTSFVNLGSGNYSGTVQSQFLTYLSAGALDFSGRTIWVDVSGTTRTEKLIVNSDATFSNIGSSASAGSLHYTSNGTLTTNTSDRRLKTNIEPITNALSKVLALDGVFYNWTEDIGGPKRIGFIAQDVKAVVPELVFTNEKTNEKYMGVHYDNVTPLLVEAVKELAAGADISVAPKIKTTNVDLHTQTVVAEDNNIELNYNGNHQTSVGGGLIVLHAIADNKSSNLTTDENGNWTTNTDFIPKGLKIPFYTPTSSSDLTGNFGNIVMDDDYLYIKSNNGWKRTKLEDF